jgi:carbon-monoxide dehydrogenase medium subunit
MPVEEFFLDYFETALEPGELLTEIQIPATAPNSGTAYTKFNIIQSDMATVGVAASVTLKSKDGPCEDVRIALGASAPTPMRATKAEEVLRGKEITDALLKEAGETASGEADTISDIAASAEYRRELVKALVPRMVKEALARAKQG